MKQTGRIALRVFYASLAVLTAAIVAFVVFQPITVLPRGAIAPGFALADSAGRAITSESLRGRMVLYSFADAACSGACAAHQEALRQAYDRLETQAGDPPVAFVTVRVDGDTEGAPPPQSRPGHEWHVVTGNAAALKRTVGAGFGVYYDERSIEPALVLVDGWGIRRAEYRATRPDPTVLTRDFGRLLEEARNSTGMARYAYEAAHLFLCY